MSEPQTCTAHPDERITGKCTQCSKPICRECRSAFGYFCSEECKAQTQAEVPDEVSREDRARAADLDARVHRSMRILKRYILPGILALIILFVLIKVTSDAGEKVWEFKPGKDRPLSPLIVASDLLLAGSDDHQLYALDISSGETKWTFQAAGKLGSVPPLIINEDLCIIWDGSGIYGLDLSTGEQQWSHTPPPGYAGQVIADGGILYYVTDAPYAEIGGPTAQQAVLRLADLLSNDDEKESIVRKVPAVHALEGGTGEVKWSRPLKEKDSLQILAAAGGRIFMVISGETEEGRWAHRLNVREGSTGKGLWSAGLKDGHINKIIPGAANVVVSSSEHLYCISSSGEELWKRPNKDMFFAEITADEELVLFKDTETRLLCLDRSTGKKRWHLETTSLSSTPLIGEDLVYVSLLEKRKRQEGDRPSMPMPTPGAPDIDLDDMGEAGDLMQSMAIDIKKNIKRVPVLKAIDKLSGETAWSRDKVGGNLLCRDDTLFALESKSTMSLTNQEMTEGVRIFALEADSGDLLWKYKHTGAVAHYAADTKRLYFSSFDASMSFSGMFRFDGSKPAPPSGNRIIAVSIGW